jgi:hypothetical protein
MGAGEEIGQAAHRARARHRAHCVGSCMCEANGHHAR